MQKLQADENARSSDARARLDLTWPNEAVVLQHLICVGESN